MPITLNKKFVIEIQDLYDNYIESYNGVYVNDWSIGTITTAVPLSSLAVNPDNGHLIAVSNNGTTIANNFAYSDNGGLVWINFNNSALPSGNINSGWRSVAFGNGKFVGISGYDATHTSKVFYSSGVNMAKPTSDSHFSYTTTNIQNNNWQSITFGNGYFVAVSDSGGVGANRIMTSKDGITWKVITTPTLLNSLAFKSIAYSEKLKRFLALTATTVPATSVFYGAYSDYDGESWSTFNLPTGTWNSIAWSPKLDMFVIVGNSGVTATSKNGVIWTLTTLSPIALNLISVTWCQELEIFIAISNSTGLGSKKVISSIDGINWIYRETNSSDAVFTRIIWNRFFGTFVGVASSGTNRIISSKPLGTNVLLKADDYLPKTNDLLYSFNYTIPKLYVTVNKQIKIHPIIKESKNFYFSIVPSQYLFPPGLTLNSDTGELSGTVIATQIPITYRIIGTSLTENKVIHSDVEVFISNSEIEITDFKYSESSLIKDKNDNAIFLIPSYTTGTNITYSSPSIPSGVSLDSTSGIISGNLSTIFDETTYTITASNGVVGKNKTFNLKITSHILRFYLRSERIEIIESNQLIEGRNEELFDYSAGYITKNSYCDLNYGTNKGLLSKNFFFDRNNNFLSDLILGIVTYYRVRKSTNTIYDSFLILEIKGDLVTGSPSINWNKLIFRENIFLKNSVTTQLFYNSATNSTIYKFNQTFNSNFYQNQPTEIIIN